MEQLKQRRGTIKASMSRIQSYCQRSNLSEPEVRVRVEKADEYFREFETIQEEIESLSTTVEQATDNENYRLQVEHLYYAIKSLLVDSNTTSDNRVEHRPSPQLTNILENLVQNQSSLSMLIQNMTSSNPTPTTDRINQVTAVRKGIKLPQIHVPEFNGQYINWIRFRDLFETMIHNRTDLSNIEKFEYLQAHLKGDALCVIKHMRSSNDNYFPAWDLIKRKYDDSFHIKRAYLELLFDHVPMKAASAIELNRVMNKIQEGVNALKALNEPTDRWDSVLVFLLERKLDPESHILWCRENSTSFEQFMQFMEHRLQELERCKKEKPSGSYRQNIKATVNTSTVKLCPACKLQHHQLFQCAHFKTLAINQRIQLVRQNNLCYNCMQADHVAAKCVRSHCKKCKLKHNTMLHRENDKSDETPPKATTTSSAAVNAILNNTFSVTLLPTALIPIQDVNKAYQLCRVMLDTGSQVSLITEECVQRLNLKRSYDRTLLHGVGENKTTVTKGKVKLVIQTKEPIKNITTSSLCVHKLTQYQPAVKVDSTKLEYFSNLSLADPDYNVPKRVDIILGADILGECLLTEKQIHPSGSPIAWLTTFGWVIMGNVTIDNPRQITIAHVSEDLSSQLREFWETEELHENKQYLTTEEEMAEKHYQQNVSRVENGQYMVRLPFKTEKPVFGQTRSLALKRLNNMECRFNRDDNLRKEYHKFMEEFKDLHHMELKADSTEPGFYMPHHAVLKPTSTTTKLRVVFDGSAKGSNGISLNNQLLVGPTIQNDLFTILLNFRKYEIAMCSDIEKMYRQILIHPDDRAYQCILWRHEGEISTFCLKTVTYGTSAAPFLAIRTLNQIAMDCERLQPDVSNTINECFYVDDLMCSVSSVKHAIQLKNNLNDVLSSAQLHLRKWMSNSELFVQDVNSADRAISATTVIDNSNTVKTLGMLWDTSNDNFKYEVRVGQLIGPITKRIILSTIAKVFDPLGWLAPIIITLKLFMQTLWIHGTDWDTELPINILQQWKRIYSNLSCISEIHIPRWLQYSNEKHVELHGYSDASELAFAAVVYLKVTHDDGKVSTRMIASKTRVAPVKQITLPRLELCAAQLVVKLLVKIKNSLKIENIIMHGWTDSTIVLSWLADHPRRWKNFVANRTSYVINILPAQFWHHVKSKENPADLATRGLLPSELMNNELWWMGPLSLKKQNYDEHQVQACTEVDMEQRKIIVGQVSAKPEDGFSTRYSEYNKLNRIIALVIRFTRNCRSKKYTKITGFITTLELQNAHNFLIKESQQGSFKDEIGRLQKGKQMTNNNQLIHLSPFIDKEGLLRVGGRLENANIAYGQRHPLILNKDSHLTTLIITYYHLKYLHAGSRQLQYLIGLKYWIPSIIYAIKRCVYKCTTCMRFRNKPYTQQMGNLPKHRITMAVVFQNVGIDFAGPMLIRSWKGRGNKQYKCWVALFVCLSTKAIHLELVTSLSANAFVATLRRFVSRRGKPTHIYSDNGTNFVGCNNKLKELTQFLNKSTTQDIILKETTSQGIVWHFSPPSGPHFGGLWEAGVKSVKYHLNRVLSNNAATYEELNTILCQIEACLNSRPLCLKFQGDPDPITPAHFLIHRNMESVPDEDVTDTPINRLTRWQYIQQLTQNFWKKWSNDYLKQLQPRPKWAQKLKNLEINDMVIVKDEQLPHIQWRIGKVIDTHPGTDGLVRVVTIKTCKGSYKRPVHKLCPLFVDC